MQYPIWVSLKCQEIKILGWSHCFFRQSLYKQRPRSYIDFRTSLWFDLSLIVKTISAFHLYFHGYSFFFYVSDYFLLHLYIILLAKYPHKNVPLSLRFAFTFSVASLCQTLCFALTYSVALLPQASGYTHVTLHVSIINSKCTDPIEFCEHLVERQGLCDALSIFAVM